MQNYSFFVTLQAKLICTINSTLVADNNQVPFGSGDHAPRVVPEVLVMQKSVNLAIFNTIFLPGLSPSIGGL